MSVHRKADPGELIQWVTHESRSSAASNSGLIRIGTQPRTADAWHHDSCRPRGVVTRDFSAIFDRLFDRLPVRILTSDLHHWILRKKIFHIRAYDFGVQFSFNYMHTVLLNNSAIAHDRRELLFLVYLHCVFLSWSIFVFSLQLGLSPHTQATKKLLLVQESDFNQVKCTWLCLHLFCDQDAPTKNKIQPVRQSTEFFLNKFQEERKVKSQTSIVWTFKFFLKRFFLVFLARIIHD